MLARLGVDVTLVCRGAHLAAVRANGLRIALPGAEFTVGKIPATADPAEVGPVDVLIQAAKLYDLAETSRAMLPMVGPKTMVLPVQNGVTATEEVGAIVGPERVAGGLVYINASLQGPGHVSSRGEINTIVMGEPVGALSGRVLAFRDLCEKAGLDARASEDIRAEQWRKFIPVAGLSALSCLSRQPIGPVRDDPALRKIYLQALQEVADLAMAKGVRLEDDIVERTLAIQQRYKADARVSMLQDLEAGKRLELEWLSGYVSREGARFGVATPFHDLAYACLKHLNPAAPR
jgi:2-dehydropantoate 2-reductase